MLTLFTNPSARASLHPTNAVCILQKIPGIKHPSEDSDQATVPVLAHMRTHGGLALTAQGNPSDSSSAGKRWVQPRSRPIGFSWPSALRPHVVKQEHTGSSTGSDQGWDTPWVCPVPAMVGNNVQGGRYEGYHVFFSKCCPSLQVGGGHVKLEVNLGSFVFFFLCMYFFAFLYYYHLMYSLLSQLHLSN